MRIALLSVLLVGCGGASEMLVVPPDLTDRIVVQPHDAGSSYVAPADMADPIAPADMMPSSDLRPVADMRPAPPPCGAVGQVCCAGGHCTVGGGNFCDTHTGRCTNVCGALGQACCPTAPRCGTVQNQCFAGFCY